MSVSPANHIYEVDGPGYTSKDRPELLDHIAFYGDFLEWVEVDIAGTSYQCSEFYKWHAQFYIEPKNDTQLTRSSTDLQELGSGWITIPDDL